MGAAAAPRCGCWLSPTPHTSHLPPAPHAPAGLLLANLSVYRGCDIVFDSMDVPEAALDGAAPADPHATVRARAARLGGLGPGARGAGATLASQTTSAWPAEAAASALPSRAGLSTCPVPCRAPLPPPQVNLGSLQQQLAALQLHAGGERLSPTLDAILELLEEAPGDGAAAAADAFVAEVAAAGGAPLPAAQHAQLSGEDGDEAAEGEEGREAAMEGVVAEYAYAGAPDLADVPPGALSWHCVCRCVLAADCAGGRHPG